MREKSRLCSWATLNPLQSGFWAVLLPQILPIWRRPCSLMMRARCELKQQNDFVRSRQATQRPKTVMQREQYSPNSTQRRASRFIAVTFSWSAQLKIPEYWIASMAIVQYEGTSDMTKSATERSPARMPARPESNPVPNRPSKPAITKFGASEANI